MYTPLEFVKVHTCRVSFRNFVKWYTCPCIGEHPIFNEYTTVGLSDRYRELSLKLNNVNDE